MPLKYKWPKYSKILKNDQNTPKPQNYQNNHKTYKMTKYPETQRKWPKYPQNPKNDQNTPPNLKITKIPLKPIKWPKIPPET